jgi:ABC-type phosphate transport system substrate-binding protein
LAGCNRKSSEDLAIESDDVKASPSGPTSVLGTAGSTFIAPLMSKWVSGYQKDHPKVEINYRPIGSGGGMRKKTEPQTDSRRLLSHVWCCSKREM